MRTEEDIRKMLQAFIDVKKEVKNKKVIYGIDKSILALKWVLGESEIVQ
jgi:hypothetical protein